MAFFFAPIPCVGEGTRVAGKPLVQPFEIPVTCGFDEEEIGRVYEIVAGRAGNRPFVRQSLGTADDFLDDHVRFRSTVPGSTYFVDSFAQRR